MANNATTVGAKKNTSSSSAAAGPRCGWPMSCRSRPPPTRWRDRSAAAQASLDVCGAARRPIRAEAASSVRQDAELHLPCVENRRLRSLLTSCILRYPHAKRLTPHPGICPYLMVRIAREAIHLAVQEFAECPHFDNGQKRRCVPCGSAGSRLSTPLLSRSTDAAPVYAVLAKIRAAVRACPPLTQAAPEPRFRGPRCGAGIRPDQPRTGRTGSRSRPPHRAEP